LSNSNFLPASGDPQKGDAIVLIPVAPKHAQVLQAGDLSADNNLCQLGLPDPGSVICGA
jgi:hypothetical protein